jgi:hypothetical protein
VAFSATLTLDDLQELYSKHPKVSDDGLWPPSRITPKPVENLEPDVLPPAAAPGPSA